MKFIDNVLMNIGIYPNKNGYRYIKVFIEIDPDLNFVDIYKIIANMCDTTPKTVYGAIQRAISGAYCCGKLKNIDDYLHAKIYDENHILTNSEFLSLLQLLVHAENKAA